MDINLIWSSVLSVALGGLWFFIRERIEEIKRIDILLNKTREEIARDYATNSEVQRVTDHIDQRFNRLEAKIDQLIQQAHEGAMMATSKLKMVKKGGKTVPAFAADGIGKMKKGGMAMKSASDKMGRAVKRKTADVKGRAMKKGA